MVVPCMASGSAPPATSPFTRTPPSHALCLPPRNGQLLPPAPPLQNEQL